MTISKYVSLDILGEEAKMESVRNVGTDLKPKTIEDLKARIAEYLPGEDLSRIDEAYEFAALAHAQQLRRSGEPFVEHPLQTALLLADLQLDLPTVIAALLHDVPEDCGVPLATIEKTFGREVRTLVEGVTKLSKIAWHARDDAGKVRHAAEDADTQAENLRKMLISMADDIRVVLIKLADRLHNMRTLSAMPPAKRRTIAQETMEIYAPLASRLGIWEFKWELEDLSFRYLDPEKYREVAHLISSRRVSRERYISQVVEILRRELAKAGIKADVNGRPKHIFSVNRKMEKYALHGKDFGQIYDLLAIRVLVDSVQDCYTALGVVHSLWRPIPGQFDDYIANPKESMYQSLHTTVMCLGARPLEIQVRTHEMHRIAEYGIAAHWRYKEGAGKKDTKFDDKIAWLRQLMEWQRDVSGAQEFVESVKTDIFHDQVFIYTPKGEIKDLPTGSTPLDFAYQIHTDLGHRCIGAKVNGRLVPLDSQVHNGDIVEILTSKTARGPSRDWLNPSLGYIKTSRAKEKIRQWFKRQERVENVDRGKELLDKELRRLGLSISVDDIARLFKFDKAEELLLAIGIGEVNTHQIAVKLAAQEETEPELTPQASRSDPTPSSIEVMGVGDLLTHLAQCCNPVPGDEIIGYITRMSGVTVHRKDCHNVKNQPEKERLVRVDWGRAGRQLYPVPVKIEAWDRVGLLRDVSSVVSEEKVNMTAVQTVVAQSDRTATISLTLEISGIGHLSRVLSRLEGIKGVTSVVRDVGRIKAT